MAVVIRKKSPRAPSMSLDEAVDKAFRVYEKEQRHPAPVDVVAKHIGYKDAKNGAALSSIASLGYYGLVERPKEGYISVSADVEAYKYAPTEEIKRQIALKWLRAPQIFSDLLEKYGAGLPSDATLQYDLIQRGFKPESAAGCVAAFRRSLDFSKYFEMPSAVAEEVSGYDETDSIPLSAMESTVSALHQAPLRIAPQSERLEDFDRIPVRLSGGRRAWIEIPTPFYCADKGRMKAQIDLLLADDEGDDDA